MPIVIGGVNYLTTEEAEKHLPIKANTLSGWLRDAAADATNGHLNKGLVLNETYRKVGRRWYVSDIWIEKYLKGEYNA